MDALGFKHRGSDGSGSNPTLLRSYLSKPSKQWERGSFLVMMQISAGWKNLSLRGSVHSANRRQADAPNE